MRLMGTSKLMTSYTVYDINVLSTVSPGYVKIDDVLHRLWYKRFCLPFLGVHQIDDVLHCL